jgi:hypothetical protein
MAVSPIVSVVGGVSLLIAAASVLVRDRRLGIPSIRATAVELILALRAVAIAHLLTDIIRG